MTVTALLCLINNEEKVQTHSVHQDGSGAHDTNHRTAIINLIVTTPNYFQLQSRRAFFNQIDEILEFNYTAQKTTFFYLTWFRSFSVCHKESMFNTITFQTRFY